MGSLVGKIVEVRRSSASDATTRIGEALREMRRFSGLTQAEMAQRLAVGQASVSKVEKSRADVHVSTI